MNTAAGTATHRPHRPWLGLIGFGAVVTAVAAFGSVFASGSAETYAGLDRPSWAPPSWLFGPAWTVLYVTIAVSGWLVWRHGGFEGKALPFTLYGLQLALNAAWTPLFFGAQAFGAALIDIVVLLVAIIGTIATFARHSVGAAVLLIPYLLWVGYATALNAAVR
ncbi:MAG TPA: TspO/MBR family protein [Actinopolymorphaceae bacterium]